VRQSQTIILAFTDQSDVLENLGSPRDVLRLFRGRDRTLVPSAMVAGRSSGLGTRGRNEPG